jgi:protein involved in sex pheromone biosynthesis
VKKLIFAAVAALALAGCFDGKKAGGEDGAVAADGSAQTENNEQTTSREKSTNYDSRLVGTWIKVNEGSTWTFNSDGTMSRDGKTFSDGIMSRDGKTFKYGAIDGKLVIVKGGYPDDIMEYVISKDGKTLIIDDAAYLDQEGLFQKKQ